LNEGIISACERCGSRAFFLTKNKLVVIHMNNPHPLDGVVYICVRHNKHSISNLP